MCKIIPNCYTIETSSSDEREKLIDWWSKSSHLELDMYWPKSVWDKLGLNLSYLHFVY